MRQGIKSALRGHDDPTMEAAAMQSREPLIKLRKPVKQPPMKSNGRVIVKVPASIMTHPCDGSQARYLPKPDVFVTASGDQPIRRRDIEGRNNLEAVNKWIATLSKGDTNGR